MRTALAPALRALAALACCAPPAPAVMGGELRILLPSPPNLCRNFGAAVDLDGPLAVVGARGVGSPACLGFTPGAAYVFDVASGAQLLQIDGANSSFGAAVALSNGRCFVGVPYGGASGSDGDTVQVFDAVSGTLLRVLRAADGGVGSQFGFSLAADGDLLVVGAPNDDDLGSKSGSAYVFDLSTGTELKLLAPGGAAYDLFGRSVGISDGLVVVGAPGTTGSVDFAGAAYVFDAATGAWITTLEPADGIEDDGFGWDVALDGTVAVVGAPFHTDGAYLSGAIYVYDALSGVELTKLVAAVPVVQGGIGRTVAVEGDRVATARSYSIWGGEGRLTLFDRVQEVQLAEFIPAGGTQGFGGDLVLYGGLALAGLAGSGNFHGAAFLFDTADGTAVPYCFGAGSGTPCPCGNAGAPGHGCANSDFSSGARLYTTGQAVVDFDTLVLRVEGSSSNAPGLFFQGDDAVAGGAGAPFGDGLRCAGTNATRLQVTQGNAAGAAASSVPIGAAGGASAGDVRRYQWWYRDPVGSPCGSGFNLSNGLEVVWAP